MKEFSKEEYDRLCAEFMGWEYFPESKSGNTWPDGCHDGSYTSFSMWIKNPTEKYREILCHDGYEYLDGEYNSEIEQSDLFEDYKYQLKYDSDWNEIMEVVDKIESITLTKYFNKNEVEYENVKVKISFERKNPFGVKGENYEHIVSFTPQIWSAHKFKGESNDRKEAVVQAIWVFLNWYNQQEK